jgi:peptide/nickel transport system ATP-binding protein
VLAPDRGAVVTGAAPPALSVERLVRRFRRDDGRVVTAVDGVSFEVAHNETLGLVGESGCGKSSLARALMQLPPPDAGSVRVDGQDLSALSAGERREAKRRLQMVFQDPISSLNPRRRIADIVAEPLSIWGAGGAEDNRERVVAALGEVGFDADTVWSRRPHELSGGQCQRVAIARALMLEPTVLVLDEPVSALDVSVQAQILNLLLDIRSRRAFSMIFISHDLAVIRNVCDRVAVMYLGRIVEVGVTEDVYGRPRHPYTRALLDSVLAPGQPLPDEEVIHGELPSLLDPPSGCPFRTRCPRATERCAAEPPALTSSGASHLTACHHPLDGHAGR